MARILFRNCRVWDGSGAAAYPADVLVEGERIRAVARERGQLEAPGAEVIEAGGMTLMPGLVEGHAHITFINGARPTDLGDTPPEEHTLIAARNARVLLDHGFTGAYSAASAKLRIDVVIRNAIEAGELPGPSAARLRAGDHGDRRSRRRTPRAPVPRQLRDVRRRAGGGDQARPGLRARGRGQHQAEHLRRRSHPQRRAAAHGDERGRDPCRRHRGARLPPHGERALPRRREREARGPMRRRCDLPLRACRRRRRSTCWKR